MSAPISIEEYKGTLGALKAYKVWRGECAIGWVELLPNGFVSEIPHINPGARLSLHHTLLQAVRRLVKAEQLRTAADMVL